MEMPETTRQKEVQLPEKKRDGEMRALPKGFEAKHDSDWDSALSDVLSL